MRAGLPLNEAAEPEASEVVGHLRGGIRATEEGGDAGSPVVLSDPDSPAGQALIGAARALARSTRSVVGKPLQLTVAPGAGGGNGHDHAGHDGHAGHDHAGHGH